MESTLAGCLLQNSASPSCNSPLPPTSVNKSPLDYSTDHCSHLSFAHLASFFLSSPPPPFLYYLLLPQTPCLYMFPSSSLALVISPLLLNLFLFQSVSLLYSFLVCECKSSLGVLLYFLGSAVVDWNGGLCHFYLLPHRFHNSVSMCMCVHTCLCVLWCAWARVNAEWLQVFELQWGVSGSIAPSFLWTPSSTTVFISLVSRKWL